MMKKSFLLCFILCAGPALLFGKNNIFRPPAYPIITHDPYLSIWLQSEIPTSTETVHWAQKPMPIRSLIRIDGNPYRLMGKAPGFVPPAKIVEAEVLPTRTVFAYFQDGVKVRLTFLTPILLDDLDLVSRPVSYVSWSIESSDGKKHSTELYFDISGLASLDRIGQCIVWDQPRTQDGLQVLKMGSLKQPVLEKSGDDLRIDWGYLYAAIDEGQQISVYAGKNENALMAFAEGRTFPVTSNEGQGGRAVDLNPILAFEIPADIPATGATERHLLIAYDDIFSVEFLETRLEGYWKKKFSTIDRLLATAAREYPAIKRRCLLFDTQLTDQARRIGGYEYAHICSLAYRQCMAAHKIVKDIDGQPLCFSKENWSNGSMGTVDVFYPASPYFLYLNPDLLKAQMTPIFKYVQSGRWPWVYAPHDLGKYPLANGQKYGGGEVSEERQMPVEESGNMLILSCAIAKVEGNADYAALYWDILTQWAEYLREKGFDPENQLCTDDFTGHMAHNTNLSIKAIMGLASYASLCQMRGFHETASDYEQLARQMAKRWVREADDGDHFRLAFDKPGTWSQKYNMVWDDIMGFHLFEDEVESKEIDYYLKTQQRYGLPLDSRITYTKLDWVLWSAAMAHTDQQFCELMVPVYHFLNETPDRLPMTDRYWTKTGEWKGFVARSVVGGVYMKLFKEKISRYMKTKER